MRPLLLSLMISAFTSGIAAFRRLNRSYFQLYSPQPLMTETQLNFKSYFLQFVLCQYVKDLLDSFVRGEIPESNRNYNRFS